MQDASRLFVGIIVGAVIGVGGVVLEFKSDLIRTTGRLDRLEEKVEEKLKQLEELEGTVGELSTTPSSETRETIFADYFTGNAVGWLTSDVEGISRKIENGKYVFRSSKEDWNWWSSKKIQGLPQDFVATLRLQWTSGSSDGSFGLFLGWNDDNFYCFGLTPDGYSVVRLQKNDKWAVNPISTKGIQGVDKTDFTIKVALKDKRASFYLDDNRVGSFAAKDFDLIRVGTYVSGKQEVEFDSLVIETSK